jgi:Cu2+-exporting ATPase
MHCEGDKVYDEPGRCGVYVFRKGPDTKERTEEILLLRYKRNRIRRSSAAMGKYYCPMHCEGDKVYEKAGDCPVCGMDLVKAPNLV